MQKTTPAAILENLNWRYATKTFNPAKKIPDDLWETLEEAIRLAPSSFGLQPWKFIVVNNPELRAKLRGAANNQKQVTDASHLVVFCRQLAPKVEDAERWMAAIVRERGVPRASL